MSGAPAPGGSGGSGAYTSLLTVLPLKRPAALPYVSFGTLTSLGGPLVGGGTN